MKLTRLALLLAAPTALGCSASECGAIDASSPDAATDAGSSRDARLPGDDVDTYADVETEEAAWDASQFCIDLGACAPDTCPAALPQDGAPCSATDFRLSCEYGDDPEPYCNAIATCGNDSLWHVSPLHSLGCPTMNAAACAPTPSGNPVGTACTPPLACVYPQGVCGCTPSDDGGYSWVCGAPGPPCPTVRPRLGSACTDIPHGCQYGIGQCTVLPDIVVVCCCGTWREEPPPPCPPVPH